MVWGFQGQKIWIFSGPGTGNRGLKILIFCGLRRESVDFFWFGGKKRKKKMITSLYVTF